MTDQGRGHIVEVKIGIQHSQRELVVDTHKGRKVVVPAGKLAYVEIGGGVIGTVGFRS